MTNHWRDFKNSDVILVIGANPAENHPCGWRWAQIGRDERGTKIIHVDPRYTRTSAIADLYAPIRAGTDVAFFGGLINYILEKKLYHEDYVKLHTNASFIVGPDFTFDDGMFSGYDEAKRTYDPTTWDYDRLPPVDAGGGGARAGGQPPGSSGGASALGGAAGAASGGSPAAVAGTPRRRTRRLRQDRPDAAGPPLGLPADEGPLRPLHAGEGLGDHRHAGGEVPQDRRAARLHRHGGQGRQHRLRGGPHPPHHRRADHPGPRPGPDAAGQHGPARAAASTPSGATPTSRGTPTTPSAGRSSPATSPSPSRA